MDRNPKSKALEFEGIDIMTLLAKGENLAADELTKGRIRTIYSQVKYGNKSPREIAEYYNLPVKLIRDIANKKIFQKIIEDL